MMSDKRDNEQFVDENVLVSIEELHTKENIALARELLLIYGASRNFDDALGDFNKELKEIAKKYGPPQGAFLLAKKNTLAIGCVALQPLEKGVCEMKRLFVKEELRGKGLGRKLVRAIIHKATLMGYCIMRLDSHSTMTSAIQLYLQEGFREIDRYNRNPLKNIRFFEKALINSPQP